MLSPFYKRVTVNVSKAVKTCSNIVALFLIKENLLNVKYLDVCDLSEVFFRNLILKWGMSLFINCNILPTKYVSDQIFWPFYAPPILPTYSSLFKIKIYEDTTNYYYYFFYQSYRLVLNINNNLDQLMIIAILWHRILHVIDNNITHMCNIVDNLVKYL